MIDDVEAVERAGASISAFINSRSKAKEKANAQEELWRASECRHRHKVRLANGHAWVEYFENLASSHERRADEFRDRSREVSAIVEALVDETPGPEEEGEGVAAVS